MKTSELGLSALMRREGVRFVPYKDGHGYWTCGVGIKMNRDPLPNEVWAPELVDSSFRGKLIEFEDAVNSLGVELTAPQFDSCVSLAYNIGAHAFETSTVAKQIIAGNHVAAADAFLMWSDHGAAAARRLDECHVYRYGTKTT